MSCSMSSKSKATLNPSAGSSLNADLFQILIT
jgi:hypothetical protein